MKLIVLNWDYLTYYNGKWISKQSFFSYLLWLSPVSIQGFRRSKIVPYIGLLWGVKRVWHAKPLRRNGLPQGEAGSCRAADRRLKRVFTLMIVPVSCEAPQR